MELKKNILVVDDDAVAIFLIEKIVTSTGLAGNVYKALNGKEALAFFNSGPGTDNGKNRPEVVLLDLNMPIIDGFEFLEAYNTMNLPGAEKAVIIVVTSSYHPHDMQKAKAMGIKHYLTKPISAGNVRDIILKEFAQEC
jgi:CheY-like chemotaxis protein